MRAIFSSLACSFLYAFLRILFVSTYAHTPTSFLILPYFLPGWLSDSTHSRVPLLLYWCLGFLDVLRFFFCTAAFCAAFSFLSVHFFYFKHALRPYLFNVRLLAHKPNHSLSLSLENWGLLQFIFLAIFQYVSSVHSRSIFGHWLLGRPKKFDFFSQVWSFILHVQAVSAFHLFSFISLSLISQPKTSERANEKLNTRN